jgi:hypothetical protein
VSLTFLGEGSKFSGAADGAFAGKPCSYKFGVGLVGARLAREEAGKFRENF